MESAAGIGNARSAAKSGAADSPPVEQPVNTFIPPPEAEPEVRAPEINGIAPGARKSLPGAVPPPVFDENEELSCFLCPGVRFLSRDVLSRHCNTEHSMESFIRTVQIRRDNKPQKCPFCIFRALKVDRFLNHLKRYHTSEDIYLFNLRKMSRENVARKRQKRMGTILPEQSVIEPNDINASMFCSLCDYSTKVRANFFLFYCF